MTFAAAVDIGGTFTDLVAYDRESGRILCSKSPTSYDDLVFGILDCFAKASVSPREATTISHGTTLVINSLLQRRGAHCALVTTRGFRDVLEIARCNRPDPFDLHYHRDEPLIARDLRFEIEERVDSSGRVLKEVDEAEIVVLAQQLDKLKIEAVAIFLINSYANPEPERRVAQSLRRLLPDVYVTCSVDLTREWYEYERCATVAANAFVGPSLDLYLGRLRTRLVEDGFDGSIFMMGSNGGLLSLDHARRRPIAIVESGPIGGCIGAAAYAQAIGSANIIAFDMGGTTAKCAQIVDGRFTVHNLYNVGGYERGFPIRASVIDITEVGSGGGSIAKVDVHGRLTVGPESAGSTPGPACYGRGGEEPTITDANLILGRLDPEHFVGGELRLDVEAARRAVSRVGERLGYREEKGLWEFAEGMIAISTVVMADAVRQVSIRQGLDPRDFVLFCYGGGGPLHGCALAHELSIPVVIVPPEPGNFSALGMLLSDARIDLSSTFASPLEASAVDRAQAMIAEMERDGAASIVRDFGAGTMYFERSAEMRFVGQRHNIKVPLAQADNAPDLHAKFIAEYSRRYGHASPDAAVEIITLHLSVHHTSPKPSLSGLKQALEAGSMRKRRRVYFSAELGWCEADVHLRAALPRGFAGQGPALIEEYGSTTLIWPGDRFTIGDLSEIRIDCALRE